MSLIAIPERKCHVAVVGAGPVGIMTACLVKALNENLVVKVFDKRPSTTRDHALRIGSDSIDKIHALCRECLAHSAASTDQDLVQKLLTRTKGWKKKHVRTSTIEEELAELVREKIQVFRGPEHEIKASAFQDFLDSTNAQIIIGADGATDSQVREAIGAEKIEEKPLSYLLELKYTTTPESLERNSLESSTQAIVAEGWDFETMGRTEEGNRYKRVTLHKFVDAETHRSLLVTQPDKSIKGTTAKPWTIQELSEQSKKDPKVRWVKKHIERYFDGGYHSAEKIVTFPMAMFRSTHVVKAMGNQLVVLAGDASAGVVLERGVNKGLIEAALCAKAVITFFEKSPKTQQISPLPPEFETYTQETLHLYKTEKRWAEWKAFGLRASEILLKIVVTPFKLVFKGLQFLWSGIRACFSVFRGLDQTGLNKAAVKR